MPRTSTSARGANRRDDREHRRRDDLDEVRVVRICRRNHRGERPVADQTSSVAIAASTASVREHPADERRRLGDLPASACRLPSGRRADGRAETTPAAEPAEQVDRLLDVELRRHEPGAVRRPSRREVPGAPRRARAAVRPDCRARRLPAQPPRRSRATAGAAASRSSRQRRGRGEQPRAAGDARNAGRPTPAWPAAASHSLERVVDHARIRPRQLPSDPIEPSCVDARTCRIDSLELGADMPSTP